MITNCANAIPESVEEVATGNRTSTKTTSSSSRKVRPREHRLLCLLPGWTRAIFAWQSHTIHMYHTHGIHTWKQRDLIKFVRRRRRLNISIGECCEEEARESVNLFKCRSHTRGKDEHCAGLPARYIQPYAIHIYVQSVWVVFWILNDLHELGIRNWIMERDATLHKNVVLKDATIIRNLIKLFSSIGPFNVSGKYASSNWWLTQYVCTTTDRSWPTFNLICLVSGLGPFRVVNDLFEDHRRNKTALSERVYN